MRRTGRYAATAIMAVILVAACGSTSDGGAYTNPTTGPLPTYDSIDSLSRAVDSACSWMVLPASSSGENARFCTDRYVIIITNSPSDPQGTSSVESVEFNAFLDDPKNLSHACIYWDSMSSVAFVALPQSAVGSGGRKTAAAIAYGGNWMAASSSVEEGRKVAAATGAYLTTAPRNCPSPSA